VLVKLPKAARLLKRRQFEMIGRTNERRMGQRLMIERLSVPGSETKLGVTVTKKYGKAHDRNRFKRCVREAFRKARPHLPQGLWINVRPRSKEITVSSASFYDELLLMLC
jgi:ribonuclease P protein component